MCGMERPNTVAGLMAKRDELLKLRKALEKDLHKVTCDIDHLDAAIALFDPEQTPRAIQRYVTKHRAKKGKLKQFVLDAFRTATGPITSRDITEAWIADRGLNADEATFVILRKRTGAVLTKLRVEGVVSEVAQLGDYKGWELK
jgi:hypothetical protein